MVRDEHSARDVAQAVFVALANQASQLRTRPILSGWLHGTTRNLAVKMIRSETRRRVREHEAVQMNEPHSGESDPVWGQIAPLLDTALGQLSEADRDALLLRYFENKPLREVGQRLGLSDDAAQKRVSRAVERLREFLVTRGLTVGASGLTAAVSANAIQAAPVGLAASISLAAALVESTAVAAATVSTAKTIAMTTLQKTVWCGVLLAGIVTPFVFQHQARVQLREENAILREQLRALSAASTLAGDARRAASRGLVSRLPAPPMLVASQAASWPEDSASTNLLSLLLQDGEAPKLSSEQVEPYLEENRRTAASLLSAYRTTGDRKFLQEAMGRFPSDAQVSFAAANDKEVSDEERRHWLEALKKAAPDNAVAGYLSARHYFKSGQTDLAVRELVAASGQPRFQDYATDFVQNDEETWRAAGYSVAESKAVASAALMLPFLGEFKQLSQDLVSLADSYRQTGDDASAQATLQLGLNLGQRLDESSGSALVAKLVGMAIQRIVFGAMDPISPSGEAGQTVQDQVEGIDRQRSEIRQLATQFGNLQARLSEQDWISYKDRWRSFGEEETMRWPVNKYGMQ